MTEKTAQLKAVASDAASDHTVTDATRVDLENQGTPPSDREPPAFDPGKFSRIEFSYEQRQQMLQTKLPRLEPECFQDTVPPNQPLVAPAPPLGGSPRSRRMFGVVIVCLLGALLLLGIAIARSAHHDPELKSVAVPTTDETAIAPSPVVPATATPVVPSAPPAVSAAIAAHPVPAKVVPPQSVGGHRTSAPPSDHSVTPRPAPSILAGTPSLPETPTTPAAPPASTPTAPNTPAPARSSWFHK